MDSINKFLSLVKFSHTIFAMPFALIGFFTATVIEKVPFNAWLLLYVILCMIFARNAAMGFNRYADRRIDAMNQRTQVREIPAGKLSPGSALWFVILNAMAFVVTAWFINPLCFYLSPVALAVVLGYSYTKRFTSFCHFVLGAGLSLAPLGAWLAVTGSFAILPVLFAVTVLCWVSGFDMIYALQDEEFDKGKGLHSIPVLLGKKGALRMSEVLHLLSAGMLIVAGYYGEFGLWYWTGAAVFTILLGYQHSLVKPGDLRRVNLAFFTTNGVASVLFCFFVLIDLFTG